MVDFLFASIEFSSLSVTVPELRQNVYSSAVVAGGRPFALRFYLDAVVPHQPLLASEN